MTWAIVSGFGGQNPTELVEHLTKPGLDLLAPWKRAEIRSARVQFPISTVR
jgi:hypothetical protein